MWRTSRIGSLASAAATALVLTAACTDGGSPTSPGEVGSTTAPSTSAGSAAGVEPAPPWDPTVRGPDGVIAAEPVVEGRFSQEVVDEVSDVAASGPYLYIAGRTDTNAGLIMIYDVAQGSVTGSNEIERAVRVAVGARHVWADSGLDAVRIGLTTNEITEFEGDTPSAWGEQVWVDRLGESVRIDPDTLEVVARATVSGAAALEVLPDLDVEPDDVFPLSFVFAGPDAAWVVEPGLGVVRLDPDTGGAVQIVDLVGWEFTGERAAVVEGGVWFVAEDREAADGAVHLLFVDITQGLTRDIVLPAGAELDAPIVADDRFVYSLASSGPLIVVDAAAGEVVATIDHASFDGGAQGLAVADGALWVLVADGELVLGYRP